LIKDSAFEGTFIVKI